MKIYRKKDYYTEDDIFSTEEVSFQPGITMLVGCNGYGKSTMISIVEEYCKANDIELLSYDATNPHTSQRNIDKFLDNEQFGELALYLYSSEGERLVQGFGEIILKIGNFVSKRKKDKKPFFITLDGIDSGLSIDKLVDCNEVLHTIQQDISDLEGYILVTSNNYELTAGFNCMDVHNGSTVKFDNYEDYRGFIFKTKDIKDRRYEEE